MLLQVYTDTTRAFALCMFNSAAHESAVVHGNDVHNYDMQQSAYDTLGTGKMSVLSVHPSDVVLALHEDTKRWRQRIFLGDNTKQGRKELFFF